MDGDGMEIEPAAAVESLRTQVAAIHAALAGLTDQLERLAEGITGVPAGTGPRRAFLAGLEGVPAGTGPMGALDAASGLEGATAGTGPRSALDATGGLGGVTAGTGPRAAMRVGIDGVPAPTGPRFAFRAIDGATAPTGPRTGAGHVLAHGDTAVELSSGARWVRVHGVLVVF